MRPFVITFIIALVLSCLAHGFLMDVPPYPLPVGLNDISQGELGLERDDTVIPEMNLTDQERGTRYMTQVHDHGKETFIEWPFGSAN